MQSLTETATQIRHRSRNDQLFYIKLRKGTNARASKGEIVRLVNYRDGFVAPNEWDTDPLRYKYVEMTEPGDQRYLSGSCKVLSTQVGEVYVAEPFDSKDFQSFASNRWSQIAKMRAAGRDAMEWQHLVPLHGRPMKAIDNVPATLVLLRGTTLFHVQITGKR